MGHDRLRPSRIRRCVLKNWLSTFARHAQGRHISIPRELDKWVRLVATHGRDSWEGQPKSANRAFSKAKAVEDGLLKNADAGALRDALAPLLAHADLYVRVAAAVWMLRLDPAIAVPVLEELGRDEGPGGGWQIDAHYVLEAFRAGTYPPGA
jgi:hypothetical protein